MTSGGEKRYFVDLDEGALAFYQRQSQQWTDDTAATHAVHLNDSTAPSACSPVSAIFLRSSSSDDHEKDTAAHTSQEHNFEGHDRQEYATDNGDHVTVDPSCVLGQGRHSRVFGGCLRSSGQALAIKQCYVDEESTECGRREVRIQRQLWDVPNIVRLYDTISRPSGSPFRLALVLQRASKLSCGTMRQGAGDESMPLGPFAVKLLLSWAKDLFTALAGAHKAGLVHGDIKPQNLLLDDREHLLVTDWGTAMVAGAVFDSAPGTLSYTAPELVPSPASARPILVAPATDIYSAGVTLYALGTGRDPFAAISRSGVALVIAIRQGFFAAGHNPWPSRQDEHGQEYTMLRCLVEACVQADPHTRPTARHALDMLNDANKAAANE